MVCIVIHTQMSPLQLTNDSGSDKKNQQQITCPTASIHLCQQSQWFYKENTTVRERRIFPP